MLRTPAKLDPTEGCIGDEFSWIALPPQPYWGPQIFSSLARNRLEHLATE